MCILKKKKWINWIDPFNTYPDKTGTKRIALISVEARDGTTNYRFHISIFYVKNISHQNRRATIFVKKTLTSERSVLGISVDDGKLFICEVKQVLGQLSLFLDVRIGNGHVVGIDVDTDAVVEEFTDRMLGDIRNLLCLGIAGQTAFDEDSFFFDDVHDLSVMDDAASVTESSCTISDGIHDVVDGLAFAGVDGEGDLQASG